MPWYDLGEKYSVTWPLKPPGMLEQDFPVWSEYRKQTFGEFEHFFYNVPITLQSLAVEDLPKNLQRQAYFSKSKRVDVVGVRKNGEIWLIEVTSYSSLRSIGQAITYFYIWSVLKPLPGPFMAVILCTAVDEDIRQVAKAHNIKIIELHPY